MPFCLSNLSVKGVCNLQYNIIDIVPENLTNTKLKEIINKKLYRIIELMESSINAYK